MLWAVLGEIAHLKLFTQDTNALIRYFSFILAGVFIGIPIGFKISEYCKNKESL